MKIQKTTANGKPAWMIDARGRGGGREHFKNKGDAEHRLTENLAQRVEVSGLTPDQCSENEYLKAAHLRVPKDVNVSHGEDSIQNHRIAQ